MARDMRVHLSGGPQMSILRKRTSWEIQVTVVFALLLRELKTRFGGKLIGLFWVLFEPVLNVYILLFVRGVLRTRIVGATIAYPVYHVVAMIPYFVFRSSWFRTMEAVSGNAGLFAYRQVKPFDAMIARTILEAMIYFMVFLVVLGSLAWFGYKYLPDDPLQFIACWFVNILLGFGLGEVCLVLTHGKPNAKSIVRLMSMPLYLLSGILIPLKSFPPNVLYWLMLNPTANLVELERQAYYHEYTPALGTSMMYPVMCALVLLGIGHSLYRLNHRKLTRR
jgi:capsular polysaccharide transport system permease protein